MDRSRYTRKVDTSQIQQDLQHATTDAEMLLYNFEMETLDKLRQRVQATVAYAAQQSEQRLNKTLLDNCAREYKQLYEKVSSENRYLIAAIETRITAKQRRLEKMLWITIIIFSILLIAIISILLWFVFRH